MTSSQKFYIICCFQCCIGAEWVWTNVYVAVNWHSSDASAHIFQHGLILFQCTMSWESNCWTLLYYWPSGTPVQSSRGLWGSWSHRGADGGADRESAGRNLTEVAYLATHREGQGGNKYISVTGLKLKTFADVWIDAVIILRAKVRLVWKYPLFIAIHIKDTSDRRSETGYSQSHSPMSLELWSSIQVAPVLCRDRNIPQVKEVQWHETMQEWQHS